MLHFTVILVLVISISEYNLFVENLMQYCHDFYDFLVYKPEKTLKNHICVVTPVVTVFIFYDYVQYYMKQKCGGYSPPGNLNWTI